MFYLVFDSIITKLGAVWLVIALVGGLPGFVGTSNSVFWVFENFTIWFVKKINDSDKIRIRYPTSQKDVTLQTG